MNRRDFLNIVWTNLLKPLLLVAALFFAWKFFTGISLEASTIEVNYTAIFKSLLPVVMLCFAVAFGLGFLSYAWTKTLSALPSKVTSFINRNTRIITTLFFILLWWGFAYAKQYRNIEVVSFLVVYYIINVWSSKRGSTERTNIHDHSAG